MYKRLINLCSKFGGADSDLKKKYLQRLFYGKSKRSIAFKRFLFVLDLLFLVLVFMELVYATNPSESRLLFWTELLFGLVFLSELWARWWISVEPYRGMLRPIRIIDGVVIVTIFSQLFLSADPFVLYLVAALRVLKCYQMVGALFETNDRWSRHRDAVVSFINLLVFVFFMTALVFAFQHVKNPGINSFMDALYFTIATLTTTGFGDITMVGKDGKVLVVLIMVFGVTLFLKFATNIFRPPKIFYECEYCHLTRHEPDASHCKHCGNTIRIRNTGFVD
jgi:voltage-gated potassium channel